MAINTEYLSGLTTAFTSDVSVAGRLDGRGATHLGSTLSTRGAATFHSTVAVAGGTAVAVLSSVTIGVVAITATATKSTETTFALSGAATSTTNPQLVLVGAPSGLSAGLVPTAYVSGANVGTLRLSNVSTVDANQTAQTWRFTLLGF